MFIIVCNRSDAGDARIVTDLMIVNDNVIAKSAVAVMNSFSMFVVIVRDRDVSSVAWNVTH